MNPERCGGRCNTPGCYSPVLRPGGWVLASIAVSGICAGCNLTGQSGTGAGRASLFQRCCERERGQAQQAHDAVSKRVDRRSEVSVSL